MEIIDQEFRSRSAEDEAAIQLLQYDGDMLQNDLRNARYVFYVLLLTTVGTTLMALSKFSLERVLPECVLLVVVYTFSAWYVGRKPKTALLIGISVYFLKTLLYALLAPQTLYWGLVPKFFLFYFLIKGLIAAFKFEKIKASLRAYGEDLPLSI